MGAIRRCGQGRWSGGRTTAIGGLAALATVLLLSSCGGGGGGSAASGGPGGGLILLTFQQDGLDNISLNTRLEFIFSDSVDPATVTSQTLQIRKGGAFGLSVFGTFDVVGSRVFFEPRLPSLCDLSDSAFEPATQYRVQILGHPEEFSVRSTTGEPVDRTRTYAFTTRIETDPDLFTDQLPAAGPAVTAAAPAAGSEAVAVAPGNRIVLTLTENVKPCTVNTNTVRVHVYQTGHIGTFEDSNGGTGPKTGFATAGGDTSDQTSGDPFTWGTIGTMPNVTTLPAPQRVLSNINLGPVRREDGARHHAPERLQPEPCVECVGVSRERPDRR